GGDPHVRVPVGERSPADPGEFLGEVGGNDGGSADGVYARAASAGQRVDRPAEALEVQQPGGVHHGLGVQSGDLPNDRGEVVPLGDIAFSLGRGGASLFGRAGQAIIRLTVEVEHA